MLNVNNPVPYRPAMQYGGGGGGGSIDLSGLGQGISSVGESIGQGIQAAAQQQFLQREGERNRQQQKDIVELEAKMRERELDKLYNQRMDLLKNERDYSRLARQSDYIRQAMTSHLTGSNLFKMFQLSTEAPEKVQDSIMRAVERTSDWTRHKTAQRQLQMTAGMGAIESIRGLPNQIETGDSAISPAFSILGQATSPGWDPRTQRASGVDYEGGPQYQTEKGRTVQQTGKDFFGEPIFEPVKGPLTGTVKPSSPDAASVADARFNLLKRVMPGVFDNDATGNALKYMVGADGPISDDKSKQVLGSLSADQIVQMRTAMQWASSALRTQAAGGGTAFMDAVQQTLGEVGDIGGPKNVYTALPGLSKDGTLSKVQGRVFLDLANTIDKSYATIASFPTSNEVGDRVMNSLIQGAVASGSEGQQGISVDKFFQAHAMESAQAMIYERMAGVDPIDMKSFFKDIVPNLGSATIESMAHVLKPMMVRFNELHGQSREEALAAFDSALNDMPQMVPDYWHNPEYQAQMSKARQVLQAGESAKELLSGIKAGTINTKELQGMMFREDGEPMEVLLDHGVPIPTGRTIAEATGSPFMAASMRMNFGVSEDGPLKMVENLQAWRNNLDRVSQPPGGGREQSAPTPKVSPSQPAPSLTQTEISDLRSWMDTLTPTIGDFTGGTGGTLGPAHYANVKQQFMEGVNNLQQRYSMSSQAGAPAPMAPKPAMEQTQPQQGSPSQSSPSQGQGQGQQTPGQAQTMGKQTSMGMPFAQSLLGGEKNV